VARGPIVRIVIVTVVVTVALCLGTSLLLQARERSDPAPLADPRLPRDVRTSSRSPTALRP